MPKELLGFGSGLCGNNVSLTLIVSQLSPIATGN
jgi:hypothetical protein